MARPVLLGVVSVLMAPFGLAPAQASSAETGVPALLAFSNPVTSADAPAVVQPGGWVDFSLRLTNTGATPITDAPVVETLPPGLRVVAGTISDAGTLGPEGSTIAWTVTVDPGAVRTLSFAATVDPAMFPGATLTAVSTFAGLSSSTTHVVATGTMALAIEVSPTDPALPMVAGDVLTYTLTASATGSLDQPAVVVPGFLPGLDPALPGSGAVTYLAESARCIGKGRCEVVGPGADGLITWSLGDLPAGTSRQVTYQVAVGSGTGDGTAAPDIRNAASVSSGRTPATRSAEVLTALVAVLAERTPGRGVGAGPVERADRAVAASTLPATGLGAGSLAALGLALVSLGLMLVSLTACTGSDRP